MTTEDNDAPSAEEYFLRKKIAELKIIQEAQRRLAVDVLSQGPRDDEEKNKLLVEFNNEVMDGSQLAEIPKPIPLVKGFFNVNSLARVYGESNSLKSFLMVDIMSCVARGIPWHGFQTLQSPVLYIVAEGASALSIRIQAWNQYHHMDHSENAHYIPRAVQIADDADMNKLILWVKARGCKLVIFDTQARATLGVNENDNMAMGVIVARLEVLKRRTGACVLLVHHSGHGGRDRTSAGRGASSVFGALDTEIEVDRDKNENKITIKTIKQKDSDQLDDLVLTYVQAAAQQDDGTAFSSLVFEERPYSDRYEDMDQQYVSEAEICILRYLDQTEHTGATATILCDVLKNSGIINSQGRNYDRTSVYPILNKLAGRDLVSKKGSTFMITSSARRILENRPI